MAIRIMNKYTDRTGSLELKQGLYDENHSIIVIQKDGTVSHEPIFLGYEGEDRVRVLNFDTRELKWGFFAAENAEAGDSFGELKELYEPCLIFYDVNRERSHYLRRKEDGMPILTADGKFIIELDKPLVEESDPETQEEEETPEEEPSEEEEPILTGVPNPFIVKVEKNFCYIPNEVTKEITEYEILYALIEKTKTGGFQGNIDDCNCLNKEVFVSQVFNGYTEKSSKQEFDKYKVDEWKYYTYTCVDNKSSDVKEYENERALHKPLIKIDNTNGVLSSKKEIVLGNKGDAYVTPLQFNLKTNLTEENKADYNFEVIFYKEDGETYLVQPNLKTKKNKTLLDCWVPEKVTQELTTDYAWKIATHLWTTKEPIIEAYSTPIKGFIQTTFIQNGIENKQIDVALPLYEINPENPEQLIIASELLHPGDETGEGSVDLRGATYDEESGIVDLGIHQV